jgi:hypothetical protein
LGINPVGHSVDQLFTVPSAVQDHERLLIYVQPRRRIFIPRFLKKSDAAIDFCRSSPLAHSLAIMRGWKENRGELKISPRFLAEIGVRDKFTNVIEIC